MQLDEPRPPKTPFELLGGDAAVHKLVERFYDLMEEDPDYFGIRKLHPPTLEGSREKLFKFLTGWLGGPPLYEAEFGHPRLRARHLPFAIGAIERDQWMACMVRAMNETGLEPGMRERLERSFFQTADWMRNSKE